MGLENLGNLMTLLVISLALTAGATEAIKNSIKAKGGLAVTISAIMSLVVCLAICMLENLGVKMWAVLSVLTFMEANGVYGLTMHIAKKVGKR